MFVFGGSKALLGDNPEYPRKNLPLGNLWAFDLLSHCWHRVFGTGLHPSARSDMGQQTSVNSPANHSVAFLFGVNFTLINIIDCIL
jgi:hypothetical protein